MTICESFEALVDSVTVDRDAAAFANLWHEIATHERGEVAWVNASGTIATGGQEHPYRVTAVFLRSYAGWRCHTFSGSIPNESTTTITPLGAIEQARTRGAT